MAADFDNDSYCGFGCAFGCRCDDEARCQVGVVVHKLDEEKQEWAPVKNVGNFSFFISEAGSFSVSTQEFPECPKNTVYYTSTCFYDDEPHTQYYHCITEYSEFMDL